MKSEKNEKEEIIKGLSEIIKPEALDEWLNRPNPAFDNEAPIKLIERGDTEKIWQMIWISREGMAY